MIPMSVNNPNDPIHTFRIHHDDGRVTNIRASNPSAAQRQFLARNPDSIIRKIKIDRQEKARGEIA